MHASIEAIAGLVAVTTLIAAVAVLGMALATDQILQNCINYFDHLPKSSAVAMCNNIMEGRK